jgi:hypothetical protein
VSSWVVTGVPAVEPIVVFGIASLFGLIVSLRMLQSLGSEPIPVAGRVPLRPRLDPTS